MRGTVRNRCAFTGSTFLCAPEWKDSTGSLHMPIARNFCSGFPDFRNRRARCSLCMESLGLQKVSPKLYARNGTGTQKSHRIAKPWCSYDKERIALRQYSCLNECIEMKLEAGRMCVVHHIRYNP